MKIRELYSDESKWCKGQIARNKDGEYANPLKEDAVCWCLYGAAIKCYPENESFNIRRKIYDKLGYPITLFNDASGTTFQDIKNLVEELDV